MTFSELDAHQRELRLRELLTPQQFREWLRTSERFAIAGWAREADSCPIAKYLQSKTHNHSISVGYGIVRFQGPCDEPEWFDHEAAWATRFVLNVDEYGANAYGYITHERALVVLERIIEEMEETK